jgi:hypothetical protein
LEFIQERLICLITKNGFFQITFPELVLSQVIRIFPGALKPKSCDRILLMVALKIGRVITGD